MGMELPFLQNQKKMQGGGGPSERPRHLIDHVVDELHTAWEKKDRARFRDALGAFVRMAKGEDDAASVG